MLPGVIFAVEFIYDTLVTLRTTPDPLQMGPAAKIWFDYQKQFFWGKSVKMCSKRLQISRLTTNFSMRIEWRKL